MQWHTELLAPARFVQGALLWVRSRQLHFQFSYSSLVCNRSKQLSLLPRLECYPALLHMEGPKRKW